METQTLRKPSVERREEIAAAALRLIGERGRTAMTTANLASELGLSSGALFRHFATLDDVLRGAVALGIRRIEATFPDETLPPLERLLALARRRVQVLGRDPGLAWLVRSDEVHLTLPEDALAELRRLVARSKRFLLGAIREGTAEGSIRDDIEPEILLVPVMGTIHALIGMPGIHRTSKIARGGDLERVFSALALLLEPKTKKRRTHHAEK
jgi:AcrR family transcriptional regulator